MLTTEPVIIKAAALARKHFGLVLPVEFIILKKAYRDTSRKLHPDVEGGNEELFKEMYSAYEYLASLQRCPGVFTTDADGESSAPTTTVEGIPLSELGLGLGPTTNGRDCESCNHNGYTTGHGYHYVICQECDERGMMPRKFPCHACDGSGKFTQRRSERVVDCKRCNGTGQYKHQFLTVPCSYCYGSKTIRVEKTDSIYYNRCWKCNGTGEIMIFNPVLPKGALALKRKESVS